MALRQLAECVIIKSVNKALRPSLQRVGPRDLLIDATDVHSEINNLLPHLNPRSATGQCGSRRLPESRIPHLGLHPQTQSNQDCPSSVVQKAAPPEVSRQGWIKVLLDECYYHIQHLATMQRSLKSTWQTPRIRKLITGIGAKLSQSSPSLWHHDRGRDRICYTQQQQPHHWLRSNKDSEDKTELFAEMQPLVLGLKEQKWALSQLNKHQNNINVSTADRTTAPLLTLFSFHSLLHSLVQYLPISHSSWLINNEPEAETN
ncbi:hypothetical protein EYF80_001056 [Liparis tanakae]|uniref:Uncharacterized protein n=1 Tax=Liparis tanakae TaxID=230148 RepID=A0A4Z2JFZ8_9TELE|nr:hypothetical protein EYF80_001056 [Liparis tanakae]